MKTTEKKKILLKEYQKPDYSVSEIKLKFEIGDDKTIVTNFFKAHKESTTPDLFLDGEELELKTVLLNGQPATYETSECGITLKGVPTDATVEIVTWIYPHKNKAYEGLYQTGTTFLTQCEAQGFRRITYFFDRPDVMTSYEVTIEADAKKYPVLLSNGDLVAKKDLDAGKHQAVWKDPFKKPCYLFALVAGDLGKISGTHTTPSGKKINLEVYCAKGFEPRCQFALESLKKAMKWDEERFGREYDLATYMVVAADDFNAGAMENKGLNIFNSRLIYADSNTATDADYYNIESVMAHEYFHNWTGNRVTLRDWFHLSLKEGLTVFRDQEFSGDMSTHASVRIQTVQDLRSGQFVEDAGPNAHPIRPTSCYAVDNFFTSTIYEKGSEVIRMMQTMVGRPGFRKGMDLYFKRHDGQAVIIEDFARAIAEPNQQNWEQFKLWYSQAGTPTVRVHEAYSPATKEYSLTLTQSCPQTSQEALEKLEKKPFHIPLVIGLLNPTSGQEFSLKTEGLTINSEGQKLITLTTAAHTWTFQDISERPVLSLNRSFSSPIHLTWDASEVDLLTLLKSDADAFNRWEASQKLFVNDLKERILNTKPVDYPLSEQFVTALKTMLKDQSLANDLKQRMLSIPSGEYLVQLIGTFDPAAFEKAYNGLEIALAQALESELVEIYELMHGKNNDQITHQEFGNRSLVKRALSLLSKLTNYESFVVDHFLLAKSMNDESIGFSLGVGLSDKTREMVIQKFHQKWKNDSLVLNKWFSIIAGSDHKDTFQTVKKLWDHPDFAKTNPNRIYALLRTFSMNLYRFHDANHETYQFFAEKIAEIDKFNPNVASRLAEGFDLWPKLPSGQKAKAKKALEFLVSQSLSSNAYELIKKSLEAEG